MKLISPQRVYELLDCYGADANRWPEDERAAALAMIHNKPDLHRKLLDAQVLDMAMGVDQKPSGIGKIDHVNSSVNNSIVDTILKRLPDQDPVNLKPAHSANNTRLKKNSWVQFGIAAAISVIAVTGILFIQQDNSQKKAILSASDPAQLVAKSPQPELDQWLWQEVVGDAADDSEDPMTLLSLIELET